jgi:hypothetical protein
MKKRTIAFLSTFVFLFAFLVPVYNAEASYVPITPFYVYTGVAGSSLYINSANTATLSSDLSASPVVTKITAHQYLQKKNSQNSWDTISGGSWTKTVNDFDIYMSNTKSSLASGTYRNKTIFYVYCGTNYEVVETTSNSVTI